MATQYDTIGSKYGGMQHLPAPAIERPSVQAVLDSISGLKCLDLACGLGRWTKFLLDNDAASVTGVDISEAMVSAARQASASWPAAQQSRVAFYAADCSQVSDIPGGPFDLVLGVWFLNYAATAAELAGMWRNIAHNLKPGGRFIGVTPNVHLPFDSPVDDRYGVACEPIEKVEDGWKCRLTAYTQPEHVVFDIYHLSLEAYEAGAAEAGLVELKWHGHALPDDERKYNGYWDAYEERPQMQVCTARKPA